MHYRGTRGAAEEVFEALGPHIPAIVVFGVVYFVLRRVGITHGMIWSIMAPLVFATIIEMIAEIKWAYREQSHRGEAYREDSY